MTLVPPTAIWGRADGDVKLLVPFNGNASTDLSAYAHGAGTATSATISGGEFTVLTGASVQSIVWGPVSTLGRPNGEPWTLEGFFTWTSSDAAIDPGCDLQYAVGTYSYRFHVYSSAGKVALSTPDFGSPDAGPSASNVLSGTGKTHLAMVCPSGSGAQTLRFYVGGAQVFTFTELAGTTHANGTVSIGNLAGAANCVASIDDVRLTMRELYTGTSFTPPGSPL